MHQPLHSGSGFLLILQPLRKEPPLSDTVTQGIRIKVRSQYLPEQSDPQSQYYFFQYHIEIINEGVETVQLINRNWIITDGEGKVEEVHGAGVVGQQPVLEPGESFEYSSFCPLKTPMGSMKGSYEMQLESGEMFLAEIGEFPLRHLHTLH